MADKQQVSKTRTWWEGVKAEWRKIIWPTRDDLAKKTGTVAIVSIVLGVIIAILDFLIQNGIDLLLGLF
ncbi:MAG: preprotein translocase subunit SecE [Lachnospiraceae bacterium]|jgi:preprotein translocase subunit SecE|nr:preprotein translocase subunit SecE [Lachnospiraceae bacterium]